MQTSSWPQQITIPKPCDFHIHLRQGESLRQYTKDAAKWFSRLLVMPNTIPAIRSAEAINHYRQEILSVAPELDLIMTFKLYSDLSVQDLEQIKLAGATTGKLYPSGVTTNSDDGVSDIGELYPVMEWMEANNIVLCIHGEHPNAFCLDREVLFKSELDKIISRFPQLKIVLEHVSTAEMAEYVKNGGDNLAATITVHHLLITLDDVIGGELKPHLFCKPIAKQDKDRDKLRELAFSGHKKFFLGTDSAPHERGQKECASGCAGIYTAPVAIPILAELFSQYSTLEKLIDFTSTNGCLFYGLNISGDFLQLERRVYNVPQRYGNVVPLLAGGEIAWSLVE